MPGGWNGSGVFTRFYGATTWQNDVAAGTFIVANRHDDNDDGLATGINACLTKNGENAATADLNMGGFRLKSLATPTATTDATTKAYVDGRIAAQTVKDLSVGAVTLFDWTIATTGVKKITGSLSGMSTNGVDAVVIQLGTAAAPETAGYLGTAGSGQATGTAATFTGGFYLYDTGIAARVSHGVFTLVLLDSATNLWSFSSCLGASNGALLMWCGGSKALAGVLDLVRIRTLSTGIDVFDAGKANLMLEY